MQRVKATFYVQKRVLVPEGYLKTIGFLYNIMLKDGESKW